MESNKASGVQCWQPQSWRHWGCQWQVEVGILVGNSSLWLYEWRMKSHNISCLPGSVGLMRFLSIFYCFYQDEFLDYFEHQWEFRICLPLGQVLPLEVYMYVYEHRGHWTLLDVVILHPPVSSALEQLSLCVGPKPCCSTQKLVWTGSCRHGSLCLGYWC